MDDKNSYFMVHLLRLIWVKDQDVFGMMDRMVDMIKNSFRRNFRRGHRCPN